MKHEVVKTSYGFTHISCPDSTLEKMTEWYDDSLAALKELEPGSTFGVLGDIRRMSTLTKEVQAKLEEGQQLYVDYGMFRSSIIVDSAAAALQWKKLAKKTGLYKTQRFYYADGDPDWRTKAELWITDGIDTEQA